MKGDEKRKERVMKREMGSIMGEEQRKAVLTRAVFVLLSAAGNSVIKPGKPEPYTVVYSNEVEVLRYFT